MRQQSGITGEMIAFKTTEECTRDGWVEAERLFTTIRGWRTVGG